LPFLFELGVDVLADEVAMLAFIAALNCRCSLLDDAEAMLMQNNF
jgi:hypothetical protein